MELLCTSVFFLESSALVNGKYWKPFCTILYLEADLLQIFPDELLQGYALRVIISHGLASRESDIDGIVSRSGVINTYFTLNEQQRKVFSAFPVTTLLGFLENHMIIRNQPKVSNPKSLAAECGRIFFNRKTSLSEKDMWEFRREPQPIHRLIYCPECIREQIKVHGCGWFKLEWLIGNGCKVHNLGLVSVKQSLCSCKLNIVEGIISALSGICVHCKSATDLLLQSQKVQKGPFDDFLTLFKSFERKYLKEREKSFSVCYVRSFEEWGRELAVDRFRYLYELFSKKAHLFVDYDGHAKPVWIGDLVAMLEYLKICYKDTFYDFIESHTEILKIDCSDYVPAQVTQDFIVAKNRNCAKCEVENGNCPLKPIENEVESREI